MEMMALTERQERILDMVIREFIATAEPVASGSLAGQASLSVSSATVRGDLAALESAGFLAQPHTSAGRVPTVQGYRHFVEHLVSRARISEAETRAIRHQFHRAGREPVRWMNLSAAVLARASGGAGLVASSDSGDAPRVYHAGLTEILDEPELTDARCLREVVEVLEYGAGLGPVMDRLPMEGVTVIIGGEPPLERAARISLVVSRFGGRVDGAGVLGVVGPTRLAYERAIPTVRYVADLMTSLLTGEPA